MVDVEPDPIEPTPLDTSIDASVAAFVEEPLHSRRSVLTASSSTPRVTASAHRGASAYAPENTLAAFRLGVEMGAELVEIDVQRTKDGALVLMHDETLWRTTDVELLFPLRAPWNVRDFTLAEIKQLDAGSWKEAQFAGETVPTLAETIQLVRATDSGILLELKSPALYPGIERQVDAEFSRAGLSESVLPAGKLAVMSFDFNSMHSYKQIQPEVPVGLVGKPAPENLAEYATWADQVNPGFGSFDAAYVNRVHELGMVMQTWTVDDPDDMNTAIDLGVDGIVTNRPDVLKRVLSERVA